MPVVVLVNPPNHRDDLFHLAPPLGLLVLASVAREVGWEPKILDLNHPAWTARADQPEEFYLAATSFICGLAPDCVALTSMAINSHVSLELARRVRLAIPAVTTVVGGSHLGQISEAIMSKFSWIDHVVRGEGELGLARILTELGNEWSGVPEKLSSARRFQHPFDSYDLVDLDTYYSNNPRRVLDYEAGRGCVFKCSFCYSPTHYSEARDLPVKQIVNDFARLKGLGAKHVFMVQDNLVNNPRWCVELCQSLAREGAGLAWNGYATLPQLTDQVIGSFSGSGCVSLYLGIDAVADTQKITFNKRFFRGNPELTRKIQCMLDNGIQPLCAFIVDAYRWDPDEVELVLRAAAHCAAAGADIRINTFTRYPGSTLEAAHARVFHTPAKIQLMADCPAVVIENTLLEYEPTAFPFHTAEVEPEIWVKRLHLVRAAQVWLQAYASDILPEAVGPDNRLLAAFSDYSDVVGTCRLENDPNWKHALIESH